MLELINSIDSDILLWIQNNLRNDFLTAFFIPLTKLGDGGILFIITGIILSVFRKTRKSGLIFLSALLLNFIINNLIIKNVVMRIRPYEVIEGLKALIPPPHGYSFPSGHTSAAFTSAAIVWFIDKKFFLPAVIIAVLIGFSRMYLGVHYTTDVIFGALTGALIAVGTGKIYRYLYKNSKN